MHDTTLHTDAADQPKRRVMYKHRVLHHPLVLFFKGTVMLLAFSFMLHYLPLAPSLSRILVLPIAVTMIGFGYLAHTRRGTFMEWRVKNTKYVHLFEGGHDQLYRAVLNSGHIYSTRCSRMLRRAYALMEALSMASFGMGMGAFAVFLTI